MKRAVTVAGQADIFADTAQGRTADIVAGAMRTARQQAMSQHQFEALVQRILLEASAWGYPNLIRNQHGPWAAWNGLGGSPEAHGLCWPAIYRAIEADGTFQVRIDVRPGQMCNRAVILAQAELAKVCTVSVVEVGQASQHAVDGSL